MTDKTQKTIEALRAKLRGAEKSLEAQRERLAERDRCIEELLAGVEHWHKVATNERLCVEQIATERDALRRGLLKVKACLEENEDRDTVAIQLIDAVLT